MSLMEEGRVEYLDVDEQGRFLRFQVLKIVDCSMIATFPKEVFYFGKEMNYTHCEVHPAVMYGKTASGIPFPDHNPATR
jgi:DNA-directed RNA polymerase II subunit RPB2